MQGLNAKRSSKPVRATGHGVVSLLAVPSLAAGALLVATLLPGALLIATPSARGQSAPPPEQQQQQQRVPDLGELYRQARQEAVVRQRVRRPVAPLPPRSMRTPRFDSLRARLFPAEARASSSTQAGGVRAAAPLPRVHGRRLVEREERGAFKRRFADVRWAYLGANSPAPLDTMQTRELRARLQAHYGDPTRTVIDSDTLAGPFAQREDYVQFEYWFTTNDSIPLKVVDTGGPYDRGLVFAAPARYSGRLAELRNAFFRPLLRTRLRAPYVDYYYDADGRAWYRTGFDGRRFFTRRVRRAAVTPGRRPALERGS